MMDAVEMAVLSSVQHPNIVQVYSCLTDMIEVLPGARPFGAVPIRLSSLVRLPGHRAA
jgi:hypothetical protein